MIQLVKTVSSSDPEGIMEPQYWHVFYENGAERGRIEFGAEDSELLVGALRGVGARVVDLTKQPEQDETATDV